MAHENGVKHALSLRGEQLNERKPQPHFAAFMKAFQNPWSVDNPEGCVIVCVAENKLHSDAFLDKIQDVLSQPIPKWVLNYTMPKGSPQLVSAVRGLLTHTFLKGVDVRNEDLVLSSGVTTLLETLFYPLAEAGEGVLIPAPYYPAFDSDLATRCQVHPVPFILEEEGEASVEQQLDAAVQDAARDGKPIRALLVTNPNNPLGIIYRTETIEEMILWAASRGIHLVSDEIYALTAYGSTPFVSTAVLGQRLVEDGRLTKEALDATVHVLWGASKDFGASGLRLGVLFTRSPKLQQAYGSLAMFGMPSNLLQHALAEVWSDLEWVDDWVAENNRRMAVSYDAITAELEEAGIPFSPACGAMFLWLDFRAWLEEPTWEAEMALWEKLCEEARVIFTPGQTCHGPEPGFMRCVFTWVPKEAFTEAIHRITRVLGPRKTTA